MGESFQNYSKIQDFKADFPQVSLKMLNKAYYNNLSDLFSGDLMTVDHLNLKFLVCVDILKFFDLRFLKQL